MATAKSAILIFPHQLFAAVLARTDVPLVILVEDDLFFKQYRFHKQKLILHRASMKAYAAALRAKSIKIEYIETNRGSSMARLDATLKRHRVTKIEYYDVVDNWLEQRLGKLIKKLDASYEVLPTPAFLTSQGAIETYFSDNADRMQNFYIWQRKRLNVLVDGDKPVGGAWSFDAKNRRPLPKGIQLPPPYRLRRQAQVTAAIRWVEAEFPANPGSTDFHYAVTHVQAQAVLETFLIERLASFGPYEDAIARNHSQLFHSVLSPLLNIGLLTPRQVITRTLQYARQHPVPIESLEGFIRQIIGWREYMRATYHMYGRHMRTRNGLQHSRHLDDAWWDGSVGLAPIDETIQRVLNTGYAHHIERLMILGNAMLLLRIDPDEVYVWFMSLFIDAYDWVMVPNVYAMSQFAAGAKITTKPYISGSNYIRKMSDYNPEPWCAVWDALYWRFVADNRELFAANPRSAMMVKLYDKLAAPKKRSITQLSNTWL